MPIRLLALPLAVQLVAAKDAVPTYNVRPSCEGAAEAGYVAAGEERLKSCIDAEERARDKLAKDWASFAPGDRAFCMSSIKSFSPTYTELATCLEMKRDQKTLRAGEPLPRAR